MQGALGGGLGGPPSPALVALLYRGGTRGLDEKSEGITLLLIAPGAPLDLSHACDWSEEEREEAEGIAGDPAADDPADLQKRNATEIIMKD